MQWLIRALDEDLNLIFSRFGKILSCEVIRDKRTGDSLQYAFIEFEEQKDCEQAYFKMQGVLIDDHRIHVDFSQSVRETTICAECRLTSSGFQTVGHLARFNEHEESEAVWRVWRHIKLRKTPPVPSLRHGLAFAGIWHGV